MFKKSLSSVILLLGLLALLGYPAWPAPGEVMVEPHDVRVGLVQKTSQVAFSVTGNYQLVDYDTNKIISEVAPGQRWEVRYSPDGLELYRDGTRIGSFKEPLGLSGKALQVDVLSGTGKQVKRESGLHALGANSKKVVLNNLAGVSVMGAGGQMKKIAPAGGLNLVTLYQGDQARRYRGNMEFRLDDKGLTVVNQLPIEEYLYGVVPAEMPAYWPGEALKAQAVAARSYVLAQMGTYASQGFDVLATQASQVYRGYDGEHPAASKAVDETRGIVVTYRGRPISAVFHSSSGGYTENSEDVWRNQVEYLRGRPDPFDRNPQNNHYDWTKTYTAGQLKEQLAAMGYHFSEIYDLVEMERTSTGQRVKILAVIGLGLDGQPLTIEIGRDPLKGKADEVRRALGLKSACFTMEKVMTQQPTETQVIPVQGQQDDHPRLVKVTFRGSGWGHGVGMSQYGALGMASQGYSYQEILKYYYSGVQIVSNYGA
ncbi:SpoIID/LytB domain-containing protein [Desulfofundulus thermosubterraneus]|uniref:Stage II sporulation protein D n=1 Tax=Desulfofundulus thermosubterraneus DSM 16057 TaxID=1121432 RepID=A0A1M6H7D0_9FIRM|nr:SpoIID/LytB domain-containing protein [Desulfofundulus thermosubterraneus]SHJ18118.1 stage II sporulation protein D [Desulfofundulus thermosubterraneus DSM 16057]